MCLICMQVQFKLYLFSNALNLKKIQKFFFILSSFIVNSVNIFKRKFHYVAKCIPYLKNKYCKRKKVTFDIRALNSN